MAFSNIKVEIDVIWKDTIIALAITFWRLIVSRVSIIF